MPPRTRRTQAQRSAATQEALLDAAVDTLVELGFARTTTTEITRRAGLSLGAMLHHYPTKADLLAAAVGHVAHRRQGEFRKAMADLAPGADRLDAAIELIWDGMTSPTFEAWLELWVAARTDPELADAMREMDAEYQRASLEILHELFPSDEHPDRELLEVAMRFVVSLVDGVALRGLVVRPVDRRPIDLLKTLVHRMTPTKE